MSPPADDLIATSRCNAAQVPKALALVARAWPEVEQQAHLASLQAVLAGKASDAVRILIATQNNHLVGAVLGQILPGKVASVTPPQTDGHKVSAATEIARKLLTHLDADLRASGAGLAQALVAEDDVPAAAALRAGGYEHAADLLYMAAEADSFPDQPLALPFELVKVDSADGGRLARLVEATYQNTLDCPRIDGLRETDDVITGYRAVGESADRLWHFVRSENLDAGCLLLADHAQTQQWEIVYVGLVPEVRGRGWGLELTRHAQFLAGQAGCQRVVLAVDGANEPAIRMYATAGFRAWDRRSVWIKPLARAQSVCHQPT